MMQRVANLDFWDKIDLLTLSEIGWLWCELDPPKQWRSRWADEGPPPRPDEPPSSEVEIIIHEILRSNMNPSDPLKENNTHPERIVGTISFLRVDLRAWAERKGYQPLFLFPELRASEKNSLSLDSALQIINAILSSETPIKWGKGKDGKPPTDRELTYGLAAKIEIGCNLDRKSIGKYLKEVINIKKIR